MGKEFANSTPKTKIKTFTILRIMNYKTETKTTKFLSICGQNSIKAVFWALLFLSIAYGCSRPIQPKSDFLTIELGARSFIRYFDPIEKITYEGNEVIRLSDFIDSTMTDYPQIYAYRITGSDGYYPAKKDVSDNIWEEMQKGYIKLNTRGVVFDSTLNLPRKYNVNDVVTIELLRKIDTVLEGEEDFSFSLIIDMDVATYLDSADAYFDGRAGIKLSDFIEPFTSTPQDYTYNLISAEGEQKSFFWSEVQTGWWLLDLDVTKFYPDLGADSRIPHLQMIELIPLPE